MGNAMSDLRKTTPQIGVFILVGIGIYYCCKTRCDDGFTSTDEKPCASSDWEFSHCCQGSGVFGPEQHEDRDNA
jgi:hypothetical protein